VGQELQARALGCVLGPAEVMHLPSLGQEHIQGLSASSRGDSVLQLLLSWCLVMLLHDLLWLSRGVMQHAASFDSAACC